MIKYVEVSGARPNFLALLCVMNVACLAPLAAKAMGLTYSQSGSNCPPLPTPHLHYPLWEERGVEEVQGEAGGVRDQLEFSWLMCAVSGTVCLRTASNTSWESGEAFSPHIITSLISPIQSSVQEKY